MTPSRRQFFAAAGLAATTALSSCSTRARPDVSTKNRVAIVGGGLAGLSAALALRNAHWDVVVLEARDRVGGRVHTLHEPFTDDLHVEAGGESIDDNHDHIQALARHYNLALSHRPANKLETAAFYRAGQRSVLSAVANADPEALSGYLAFGNALITMAGNLDPAHPDRASEAERWDQQSLADFAATQTLDPNAMLLVQSEYRGNYNAELDQVSLLFVLQQSVVDEALPESGVETMRIAAGNSALPEAMAHGLGSSVRLNSPVTKVEQQPWGVRVHYTSRGAASSIVDAAKLVLAVPPPVLRNVTFDPQLSAGLRALIAELNLGHALKVSTQYGRRFWLSEGLSGFTITDLPFGVGWDATDSIPGSTDSAGVLSQFVTGSAAQQGAALSDQARIASFQQQLDIVYPEGDSDKSTVATTMAWANEPYTRGGYAVYAPGQMTRFWPLLREPHGPIWFAGEHTETLAGYMESAIRSGQRVATTIGSAPRSD
jgi:monoamine oxidase